MFHDINFKYTDALQEKDDYPEIINKAFVDIENVLEKINERGRFIVTGSKGSGKSALASKLQLTSKGSWDLFVSTDDLEQFDFRLLGKSTSEKTTGINSTINTWQMLILIRILPLFLSDQNVTLNNARLKQLEASLKRFGLIASESLISIVEYTSSKGVFSKLKAIAGEVGFKLGEENHYKIKQPSALSEAIKGILADISGTESKKYYLIIDGLDYAVRYGKENVYHLADLISASRQLNTFFTQKNINAKVIILIRDEILSLIPDPNLAKRINDNGIQIKWHDNSRDPFKTGLLEIVEKRAHLVGYTGTITELWPQWFAKAVDARSLRLILDNTRFLPRDLITFFRELQAIKAMPPFSWENILVALANYSDWFITELKDSIVGILNENVRTSITPILSLLGKEFTLEEFDNAKRKILPTEKTSSGAILHELFNTSWIGNKWEDEGDYRYAWRHRKKNAVFNPQLTICVHKGLYKTLNLI